MAGIANSFDVNDAISRYIAGENMRELSKEYGIDSTRLKECLIANGVEIRTHGENMRRWWTSAPSEVRARMSDRISSTRIAMSGLPNEDIIARYIAGESENRLSQEFGIARSGIRSRLKRAGVHIRGPKEANRLLADSTPHEVHLQRIAHAWTVSKTRIPTMAERLKMARTRQERGSHRSPTEVELERMLTERGFVTIPQQAIGPYNVDLGAYPVAIEVYGGAWHFGRDHAERFCHLFNAGWSVIIVVADLRKHAGLTAAAAEDIVAFSQLASRDPSGGGQYRMIWGDGKFIAEGGPDGHELSAIEPSRSGKRWRPLNERTGRDTPSSRVIVESFTQQMKRSGGSQATRA